MNTFRYFVWMLAAGYFIGVAVGEFIHNNPAWGIVWATIAIVTITYRLYLSNIFSSKS